MDSLSNFCAKLYYNFFSKAQKVQPNTPVQESITAINTVGVTKLQDYQNWSLSRFNMPKLNSNLFNYIFSFNPWKQHPKLIINHKPAVIEDAPLSASTEKFVDSVSVLKSKEMKEYQLWEKAWRKLTISSMRTTLDKQSYKKIKKGPPNFILNSPENLVCQGGGPKGIAYIGVARALEKNGMIDNIQRISGASAGAMAALLFALGFNSDEIYDFLVNCPLSSLLDNRTNNKLLNLVIKEKKQLDFSLTSLYHLYNTYYDLKANSGLCDGEVLRTWLGDVIEQKLGNRNCTFGEFRKKIDNDKSLKHLHISVTALKENSADIKRISSEDPECDSLIIADAILCSMSIPLVFKPQFLFAKDQDGIRYPLENLGICVDGGLVDNLPQDTFDKKMFFGKNIDDFEKDCPKFNKKTLCVGFKAEKELPKNSNSQVSKGINNIAYNILMNVFYNSEAIKQKINQYQSHRVVEIDVSGVSLLDFHLTEAKIKEMIASGENCLDEYFNEQGSKFDLIFIEEKIAAAKSLEDSKIKALAFENIVQLLIKNGNFEKAVEIAQIIPDSKIKEKTYYFIVDSISRIENGDQKHLKIFNLILSDLGNLDTENQRNNQEIDSIVLFEDQ